MPLGATGAAPPPADGANRRRLLTRARKAPNFVSAEDPPQSGLPDDT